MYQGASMNALSNLALFICIIAWLKFLLSTMTGDYYEKHGDWFQRFVVQEEGKFYFVDLTALVVSIGAFIVWCSI